MHTDTLEYLRRANAEARRLFFVTLAITIATVAGGVAVGAHALVRYDRQLAAEARV